MFENLSKKITDNFRSLKQKGVLTESDIEKSLREIRIALLEADVALPVAKYFIESLKEKLAGQNIVKNISPAQMIIKLVNDNLTNLLGSETSELEKPTNPPGIILMLGLQGSGKTTSTAKLGKYLKEKYNKKILSVSTDVYRPAAREQLYTVSEQAGIDNFFPENENNPIKITEQAVSKARNELYDYLIIDTAGRLHIDEKLIAELKQIKKSSSPIESILVADSLTGQDAVNIAREFDEKAGITGIILTKIDGDGRGGAALSMRHVTQKPIKFIGTGEKISEFEVFHPERIASRILDMGDVVTLVEKASEIADKIETDKLEARLKEGKFDFNDLLDQLKNMKKLGGIKSMMGLLPGIKQLQDKVDQADIDDSIFIKQEAIINSMTKKERRFPKLLNASRKLRIAAGAGVNVEAINRLVKQHQQMEKMVKRIKKMGPRALKDNLMDMFKQ